MRVFVCILRGRKKSDLAKRKAKTSDDDSKYKYAEKTSMKSFEINQCRGLNFTCEFIQSHNNDLRILGHFATRRLSLF